MDEKQGRTPDEPETKNVSVDDVVTLNVTTTTSLKSITFLSAVHINSAIFFCKELLRIETPYLEGTKDLSQALIRAHQAYAVGSIFAVVAFVEALINEIFLDAIFRQEGEDFSIVEPLDAKIVESMVDCWKRGLPLNKFNRDALKLYQKYEKYSKKHCKNLPVNDWYILDKYQCALVLSGKNTLDSNAAHLQDLYIVRELRNALVHYKPEWITSDGSAKVSRSERRRTKKLEDKLNNIGFRKNALLPINPFPEGYLGWGCSRWAIRASLSFASEFSERMGISPPYVYFV